MATSKNMRFLMSEIYLKFLNEPPNVKCHNDYFLGRRKARKYMQEILKIFGTTITMRSPYKVYRAGRQLNEEVLLCLV